MLYKFWTEKFYNKLEMFQMSYGISDLKLAKVMGIGRNTLWRWKREHIIPKLFAVTNFCNFYGLDIFEWIDFDDTIERPNQHDYRCVRKIHKFMF